MWKRGNFFAVNREILIIPIVWSAMIATSFWESYVEGRNAFDKGKVGFKIRIGKFVITGYHFFLFFITFPLLLSLPLVICGFSWRLFGILLSAYISGTIIEDFFWFVVNPMVKFSEWNPEFVDYYPWIKIGKLRFPLFYILGLIASTVILFFSLKD